MQRLHTANRGRLQELEERLQGAVRQQEEWVLEKSALLDQLERRDRDVTRVSVHMEEQQRKEAALEQRIQSAILHPCTLPHSLQPLSCSRCS